MENKILITLTAAGTFALSHLGGWSSHLVTLCILMAFDYACGILIPLIWGKSKHSKDGKVESRESLKGIFKKGLMLGLVLVCHRLDCVVGGSYLADGLVIALIVNEVISIFEHAKVVGIKVPFLDKALTIVHTKLTNELESKNISEKED